MRVILQYVQYSIAVPYQQQQREDIQSTVECTEYYTAVQKSTVRQYVVLCTAAEYSRVLYDPRVQQRE